MTLEKENSIFDFFETEINGEIFFISIGNSKRGSGICEWGLTKAETKKLISELIAFIEDE